MTDVPPVAPIAPIAPLAPTDEPRPHPLRSVVVAVVVFLVLLLATFGPDAGPIIDQGKLLADKSVEKRRLPDVWPPDDGDHGEGGGHLCPFLP